MDTTASGSVDDVTGEGAYLRRAQALLATRAELFLAGPARSMRLAGIPGPPQDGGGALLRRRSRQLTLPLARERTRPRARMER